MREIIAGIQRELGCKIHKKFAKMSTMHAPTSIAAAVVALVAPVGVGGFGDGLDLPQDGVQLTIGPSCNKGRDRVG